MKTRQNETSLEETLRQWQSPAVPGDFESRVLRQIRLARTTDSGKTWWETFAAGLTASAVALLVAVVVTQSTSGLPDNPLFRTGSLTGNYAQLAMGGTP